MLKQRYDSVHWLLMRGITMHAALMLSTTATCLSHTAALCAPWCPSSNTRVVNTSNFGIEMEVVCLLTRMMSMKAVRPLLTKMTGMLIRICAAHFPNNVKCAVLRTMPLMLAREGRPRLPR